MPEHYGWWLSVFVPCLLTGVTLIASALPSSPRTSVVALLVVASLAVACRICYGAPLLPTMLWIAILWLGAAMLAYAASRFRAVRSAAARQNSVPSLRTRVLASDSPRRAITCQFDVINADCDYVVQVASDDGQDQGSKVAAHLLAAHAVEVQRLSADGPDGHAAARQIAARFPFVQFDQPEYAAREWLVDVLLAFSDGHAGGLPDQKLAACVACRHWGIAVRVETSQIVALPVDSFMPPHPGKIRIRYAPLAYGDDRVPLLPTHWTEADPIVLAAIGVKSDASSPPN